MARCRTHVVLALAVGVSIAGAGVAGAAVESIAPRDGASIGPLPTFSLRTTGGEYGPRIVLYRSRAQLEADLAGGVGVVGGTTVSALPNSVSDGSTAMRTHAPIPPGRWWWIATASAPRGSDGPLLRHGEIRSVRVARVVRMTRAGFTRRGAQVVVSYVWRTNSPRLTHRTEVFHNGRRVHHVRSTIAHSPSARMEGQTFRATAALARGRGPRGSIPRGIWVVRVSVGDGVRVAHAQRRYSVR